MSAVKFAGLFGKSGSRERGRRALDTLRIKRQLAFLQLEDRMMLAGVLGSAQDFAVLAHTGVSNTGPTVIFGSADVLANVGVFQDGANAVSGFSLAGNTFVGPGTFTDGPGLVNAPAAIHGGDPVAELARDDLFVAYDALMGYGTATNLTGHDLGTSGTLPIDTLVAGVYSFDTMAQLNGVLQLDAQGTDGGVWIFKIGETLTTASASAVQLINPGGNLGADVGVYWVVGSSATLGTSTAFEGNILAKTSITLNTSATIYNGRALAENGAVVLDTNTISNICPPESSSPNAGPGFSGGLEFDDNGDLVPLYRYSLAWEKRATDADPVLLGGATFTISPDPGGGGSDLIVVDNGPLDANPIDGQILVENVAEGVYIVTETVAPTGYEIDDVDSRTIIVSGLTLAAVIGSQGSDDAGDTDSSDFHNSLLVGSISWEKRANDAGASLLPGATFSVSPDPLTGSATPLIVVDGGANDADGLANGVLQIDNVLPGTYTITETVAPAGYTIDPDATREVTVTLAALVQVIGVQGSDDPGVTDESDFHNSLIVVAETGSIAWEKRTGGANPVLLPGATFSVSPDPLTGSATPLIVVDGGINDADGLANGVLELVNVLPGTYTITETIAPTGYVLDTDPTRVVIVTLGSLVQVIGSQGSDDPGVSEESDFHNSLIVVAETGSIAWEKRTGGTNPVLLPGATFSVSPDPLTGSATPLIVVDGGINDADGLANGVLELVNVLPGTYTITETIAPTGYVLDTDPTRVVIVTLGSLVQVIGSQGSDDPGVTEESDFHNELAVGSISWEKRTNSSNPTLLPGATFSVSPNPLTGSATPLIVVDGGANDADGLANGVLQIDNVLPGTYTITETIAPTGYVLDTDPTRVVIVTLGSLVQVIGAQGSDDPGVTEESDFHNNLAVGSIGWEKRTNSSNPTLLPGATFSVSPNPLTGSATPLIVVDGGANDADGLANGVLQIDNVLPGTYTITETIAPTGYVLDIDPTRVVTVTLTALTQIIGIQGANDSGTTDESDFHNNLAVGSIGWEKRTNSSNPTLLPGATFSVSPNPLTGSATPLIVVDGGANDADGLANGVLQLNNVLPGTYTITETIAPSGYVLDTDPTRVVIVTLTALTQIIGVQGTNDPGTSDESDFHNNQISGSISWEKRATDSNPVLLAGATFKISPNPLTGLGWLTVVDGGVNDADGLANGVLQVLNVLPGTYTITETIAPAGYLIDDVASRKVTVSAADMNAVVGTQGSDQPGNSSESDFHNRLGSIAWEKRATDYNPVLLAGATFSISPNPLTGSTTPLIVVDGGLNDADGIANGILKVDNILLGTYTITETIAPGGYAIDDDATRRVTVSKYDLNTVIGTQGCDDCGDTDESDFHNRLGSIAWEKRTGDSKAALLAGATFQISPNPGTGGGTLIVVDGGKNDADGKANGVLKINNVLLGTYTITETVAPKGYAIGAIATRTVVVSTLDLCAVIGIQGCDQPGNTDESDFHNNKLGTTPPIPPSTKFYVVNDDYCDTTYEYASNGKSIENYGLNKSNTAPRGAVSTAAGDKVWVVDANRKVYIYDTGGKLLGCWTAGSIATNGTPEGIATNGTDVWIVDAKSDKVFFYAGAATRLTGSQNATSSFSLNSGNLGPKDIVTDGSSLWVVNDSTTDKVFKYTVAGSLLGSWTIGTANSKPTGLTIDPSNVSDIWIVDNGTNRVYQYTGAASRISGSQTASATFGLVAANCNPQGIADPPPIGALLSDATSTLGDSVARAATFSAPAKANAPFVTLPGNLANAKSGIKLASYERAWESFSTVRELATAERTCLHAAFASEPNIYDLVLFAEEEQTATDLAMEEALTDDSWCSTGI